MTEAQQMHVRLPRDLREWLGLQAERNGSTLNSEVVRAIRDRVDAEQAKSKAA